MSAKSSLENNDLSLRIAVIGLGHVGLPTALGFASLGFTVLGADEDRKKVDEIAAGKSPFFEPGLDDLLHRHLANGRFLASSDVQETIRASNVVFLCVGTPQREDGAADVSQIEAIARMIGKNLNGYKLIVEKSTVPAVTALWMKRTIGQFAARRTSTLSGCSGGLPAAPERFGSEASFDVASNPEFLREGRALEDIFTPNRIVIGADSDRAVEILQAIYSKINCPKVVTDLTTAELIKHASNAFLSTKISFINMVADVCDAVGADVTQVAAALGLDPRIAPGFLQAGIGFGGFCFPKDLRAFLRLADDHGVNCSLLKAVESVNAGRVETFLRKVRSCLWVLRGKTIGVLGLAFKPDTDDIREAPSLKIIDGLLKEGANLRLYDPQAMPIVSELYPAASGRITYVDSPYDVAQEAEALLLLTEWAEFKQLDLNRLRDSMEAPVVIDGRNFLDPATMRNAGFTYLGMGRNGSEAAVRESAPVGQIPLSILGREGVQSGIRE